MREATSPFCWQVRGHEPPFPAADRFYAGQVETPSIEYTGQIPNTAVSNGTTPIQPTQFQPVPGWM